MVIATFNSATGWAGKTITFENQQLSLEDHGPITAWAVLEYDRQGHLAWAYEGLREWVDSLADIERGAEVRPQDGENRDARHKVGDARAEEQATESHAQPSIAASPSRGRQKAPKPRRRPHQPTTLTMPDSKGREVMRVVTGIVAGLEALFVAFVVVESAISSNLDLVWYLSVAALVALVAVLVLAGRPSKMRPRDLIWLKVAASALLALAGGAYAAGAALYFPRLSGLATSPSDLAVLITLWTLAATPTVVTVLIHDREPIHSIVIPKRVEWRLRWPKWMWVPCVILIVLGDEFPGGIVLFGTLAAYLLVWSARRCLPDDGTQLRWPGRGGPAVAGIIGVLLAIPVLTGLVGQYGQIEDRLQQASTIGVGQGLVDAVMERQAQDGGEQASPLKTVDYSKHGISFAYETPTLKAVNIADIPVSLSQAGSVLVDPTSADRLSSVAIVPTANDPSALVIVMVPSEPPVWIDQVRGMSKSQFAKLLPQLADFIEQNVAKKAAAPSEAVTITDYAVTHRMINGTPAVVMRVSGEQNGTAFAVETRCLYTRRNLYYVMFGDQEAGPQSDSHNASLRDAFRSVTVKW
jgi:hypothetical protein